VVRRGCSPKEVVVISNLPCSATSDGLAEKYGLEKIKTIGDAYMVAAGVPSPGPEAESDPDFHGRAEALALVGLDMLRRDGARHERASRRSSSKLRIGQSNFRARVVAGRESAESASLYDLWGDAGPTRRAAWKSHGAPGRIQITPREPMSCSPTEFEMRAARHDLRQGERARIEAWYLVGPSTEQPAPRRAVELAASIRRSRSARRSSASNERSENG